MSSRSATARRRQQNATSSFASPRKDSQSLVSRSSTICSELSTSAVDMTTSAKSSLSRATGRRRHRADTASSDKSVQSVIHQPPATTERFPPFSINSNEDRGWWIEQRMKEARERVIANLQSKGIEAVSPEKDISTVTSFTTEELKNKYSSPPHIRSFGRHPTPDDLTKFIKAIDSYDNYSGRPRAGTGDTIPDVPSLPSNISEIGLQKRVPEKKKTKAAPLQLALDLKHSNFRCLKPVQNVALDSKDCPFEPFEFLSPSFNNPGSVRAHDFVLSNLCQIWLNSPYTTSPVFDDPSPAAIARYFLWTFPEEVAEFYIDPKKEDGKEGLGSMRKRQNSVNDEIRRIMYDMEAEHLNFGSDAARSSTVSTVDESSKHTSFASTASKESNTDSFASSSASGSRSHSFQIPNIQVSTDGLPDWNEIFNSSRVTILHDPAPPAPVFSSEGLTAEYRKKSLQDMLEEQKQEDAAAEHEEREAEQKFSWTAIQAWVAVWALTFLKREEQLERAMQEEAIISATAERKRELRQKRILSPHLQETQAFRATILATQTHPALRSPDNTPDTTDTALKAEQEIEISVETPVAAFKASETPPMATESENKPPKSAKSVSFGPPIVDETTAEPENVDDVDDIDDVNLPKFRNRSMTLIEALREGPPEENIPPRQTPKKKSLSNLLANLTPTKESFKSPKKDTLKKSSGESFASDGSEKESLKSPTKDTSSSFTDNSSTNLVGGDSSGIVTRGPTYPAYPAPRMPWF